MKILKAVVMAALLLVPVVALGITDTGRPAITRLWNTSESNKFVCTVSYIQPYINDNISWVITANHCANVGSTIARSEAETVWAIINWRMQVHDYGRYTKTTTDIAIGTVPDVRDAGKRPKEKLWLASKNPEHGDNVYIHGFPAGIERVELGIIVGKPVLEDVKLFVQTGPWDAGWMSFYDLFPGTTLAILVKQGTIVGGSSGSPILGQDGRLVGILWGSIQTGQRSQSASKGIPDGYDLVLFTPIERVLELLAVLQPK